jgi:hypothetical protein
MGATLVLQSYPPARLAPWLERCVQSVRDWAALRGFAYRYVDDRLLDIVPGWYRQRCASQLLAVTDLGRLLLMREALGDAGCERVIWVDADVLVFDPAGFAADCADDAGFSRECWIWRDAQGAIQSVTGINNALMAMRRGTPLLDFYIRACERIVAETPVDKLRHNEVGTVLLSKLGQVVPLALVPGVELFSPVLVADIAAGGGEVAATFARGMPRRVACANLCRSLVGKQVWDVALDERDMDRAVERLLADRGDLLNRHAP